MTTTKPVKRELTQKDMSEALRLKAVADGKERILSEKMPDITSRRADIETVYRQALAKAEATLKRANTIAATKRDEVNKELNHEDEDLKNAVVVAKEALVAYQDKIFAETDAQINVAPARVSSGGRTSL